MFVRSITQKRMIPKCSNLVWGMTLGYPASGIVLGFWVEISKVNVRVRLTAIRRGFELYECLLVIIIIIIIIIIISCQFQRDSH